jgi:DNA replication initiation complex subunit (GINS family)
MEDIDKNSLNSFLFYQLVNTFQNAAWQQMGKQLNPLTNKVEKDLVQASMSINMLDMLMAKTQGNLSADEKRLLEQIISDLKLNYVEEVNKEPAEKKETKASDKGEAAETAETNDEKDVKNTSKGKDTTTNDNT